MDGRHEDMSGGRISGTRMSLFSALAHTDPRWTPSAMKTPTSVSNILRIPVSGNLRLSNLQSRWQTVMTQLANWKSNPEQLEDEGLLAPTTVLVAVVEDVAEVLCSHAVDPPDTLLTNGDGGIVLRWRLSGRTWSIEMDVDGSIESSLLAGSQLLWRHSIHQDAAKAS